MARKPKTPPSAPKGDDDPNGVGHNSGDRSGILDLTDEEREALALQHKEQYETALAQKKKYDAEFKNACKSARAALGKDAVELIKDMILIESDEGIGKLRDRARRAEAAARYMSAALDTQFTLFGEGAADLPGEGAPA